MSKGVMLDTSFVIRLLDDTSDLHQSANDYFKYFLENDYELYISTIAIAEFCVQGSIDQLPLVNVMIKPFNISHAVKTGEFAKYIFNLKKEKDLDIDQRDIIPNDTKLFAQAQTEPEIFFYVSSDTKSQKIFDKLSSNFSLKYQFIDIHTPYGETFGRLGFES